MSDDKDNQTEIAMMKIGQLKYDRKYDSNIEEKKLQDILLIDSKKKQEQ